mmetsp:Transcript_2657/g.4270  ORF Transcript_2657/g.4270 Transcript_2657/m.4270 type:complete len:146 (-) Transcript_2657:163-600(-)
MTRVKVVNAYTCPKGKHTVYLFRCETSAISWEIERRYKDFVELHARLRKGLEGHTEIVLPPRTFFGSRTAGVVAKRRLQLEAYLNAVLEVFDPLSMKTVEDQGRSTATYYSTLAAFLHRGEGIESSPKGETVVPSHETEGLGFIV